MIKGILWYLGIGAGLGLLKEAGFPIPGIPPLAYGAQGVFLNVALWPIEVLAGITGQPITLSPNPILASGSGVVPVSTGLPQVVTYTPGGVYAVAPAPAAVVNTPFGY